MVFVCLCSCVSSVGNSVRSIDCRLGKIMIGTFDARERPVNFFVRGDVAIGWKSLLS